MDRNLRMASRCRSNILSIMTSTFNILAAATIEGVLVNYFEVFIEMFSRL